MTLGHIQKLVGETIGGRDADCGSAHELTATPTTACRMHFRSNRCHHQLEVSTGHVTAGGIYYTAVAALDTLPRVAVDARGEPVTLKRIVHNTRKIYDLDTPAYRAYAPFRDPEAPPIPLPLLQLHPTVHAAVTAADVGRALDRLKDPTGQDMDLIKQALGRALEDLLGPLPDEPKPLP